MQEYFQDLSSKNLYTAYVAARRKRFEPERVETVLARLAEAGASNASVADMLPDLYRLAAFSHDFDDFRKHFDEAVSRALDLEAERGGDPI